jgi:hypothetical protein
VDKRFIFILILAWIGIALIKSAHCENLYVDPWITDVDGRTIAYLVDPGDTIFLLSGSKTYLWLGYLHGTNEKPIVVINRNGKVEISGYKYGLKFDSSSHIKLTGKGMWDIPYGILIQYTTGAGISVDGLSTNIEIEGVEISNVLYAGIYAKTDPICSDFRSTREKFTLRNLFIHDNYIHHTGNEGMYIGNVKYLGMTLVCNGKDTTVFPHLVRGVEVCNNRIDYAGWDGLQVSSTDSGCSVHHNMIQYDSQGENPEQMSGILLGGGSHCKCYNNTIMNGKGDGIDILSLGNEYLYNNQIHLAGRSYKPGNTSPQYMKHGIYISQYYTLPDAEYTLTNNNITSPKTNCVRINNYIAKVRVINNILVDPGSYPQLGPKAFINKVNPAMKDSSAVNITAVYYDEVGFKDPLKLNFDLVKTSPAINKAIAIPGIILDFDILNRIRPFSTSNDLGAYECYDPDLNIDDPDVCQPIHCIVHYSQILDEAIVRIELTETLPVKIALYSALGHLLAQLPEMKYVPGIHEARIPLTSFPDGMYMVRIITPKYMQTCKFIMYH